MKLKYHSTDISTTTEKEFPIPTFEGDKGLFALRQVVLAYQANERLGTHSTLNHRTVSGSGKKPFNQKGTGRSRQGSRNGNQHYHGAVWKGPKPRDYSQKINKKMKTLAFQRALFDRAVSGDIEVIAAFDVAEPKTKLFASIVDRLQSEGKVLIVDDAWATNVALAGRNIERLNMCEAASLNALDLCQYKKIVLSEKGINTVLARANGGK